MSIFKTIYDLLSSVIGLLVNLANFLLTSFISGIEFFSSTFISIPNLLFDLFFELPDYFRVGLSGVFALLLVVVFFKLLILFKII